MTALSPTPDLALGDEPAATTRPRRVWATLMGTLRQARVRTEAQATASEPHSDVDKEPPAVLHETRSPSEIDDRQPVVTGITPLVPEPFVPALAAGSALGEEPALTASATAEEPATVEPPASPGKVAQRPPGSTPAAMMARMAEALQAHAVLMERYARAGYHIGRLEAENRALVGEREKLAARITELEVRLSEVRLNEQVLQAERDRALQLADELTVTMAEHGLRPVGRWQALKDFVKRHW